MVKTWENLCRLTIHAADGKKLIDELNRQGLVDMDAVITDYGLSDHSRYALLSDGRAIGSMGLLAESELKTIATTLLKFDFHKTNTAKALGISRASLYDKMKHYKLTPDSAERIANGIRHE